MIRTAASAYQALRALELTVPAMTPPAAAFAPYVRSGRLLFVSGHIARREGRPWVGTLGSSLSTADGQAAARQVALDLIGTLQEATGDLDSIRRIVKLMVLVNSTAAFTEQHVVANAASELFQAVFAGRGAHARSAFGVIQVPFGSCVEIELVAELDDLET